MKPALLRITVLLALAAGIPARGGDPAAAPAPPVWKDGVAVLGSVRVDPSTRTVLATGWVNQVSGAIELLACGKGGKTHESVFVLDVHPLDLQTGLLLLGLQPGTPPAGLGQPGAAGPVLDIRVDWEIKGKRRSLPAERFLLHVGRNRPLKNTPWLFTGSAIEDGEFKALAEESLVATYWDPWAIVNIGDAVGADDEILAVNKKAVPPLHTPITMRFRVRDARR
ncbi:MAG: hypothetical protein KA248_04080 [Kiritimatiellae bacterium]|nr:hypothetical protein [Kiritimatiellia bacterium]